MLRAIRGFGQLSSANALFLGALAVLGTILWGISAHAEDADALHRCDALASHPHDPGRYATGVTDEQFAPGAAIEACVPAVRLNPDSARAWFELGRAYWLAQRDAQAFYAFFEAAKRNYAPAMKYVGDAFVEGRGLPSNVHRDGRTALEWYKKSAAGGFSDGAKAVEEMTAYDTSHTFDPSSFQNPPLISAIYSGNFRNVSDNDLIMYISGFVHSIGGNEPFFVQGQTCLPQIAGTTTSGIARAMVNITKQSVQEMPHITFNDVFNPNADGGAIDAGQNFSFNYTKLFDQGSRDAIRAFNTYGCDGDITHQLIYNINALFDPSLRRVATAPASPAAPSSSERPLRTPAMFNCAKASMGADYVICAYPDLLDAEARLEDAYSSAKAARGRQVASEQIDWMKNYGPDCGVPFRGRPSQSAIRNAHECIRKSMEDRIAELQQ